MADDTVALEAVSRDPEVAALAIAPATVARLWDACQIPDYRKISAQNHAELIATLYKFVMTGEERIPVDWFAKQVAFADRTDGDIDTLANRIAHIRTWTFVSNRADWLADPAHWQERTKAIEDSLSDALHERLTQRFVDRRTSALMRGMKEKDELYAEIGEDGAVKVERHFVGRLKGFRFFPDTEAEGIHGKATRNAAAHVLAKELGMRVRRVTSAKSDAFKLTPRAQILWREEEIARLEAGEDPLKPAVVVLADEHLTGPDKEKVQERLNAWLTELIGERLKPLVEIGEAKDILGLGRGIAFRLIESLGVLRRESVAEEVRALDQPARAQLRKYGVRFGAFNIYFPTMLKPASTELALTLWVLKNGTAHGLDPAATPDPPRAGLTSLAPAVGVPGDFYRVAAFHPCGPRVIRIDMLERLADLIRVLVAWRPGPAQASPPKGASGDGGFKVTSDMMSILGCSAEELGNVLRALGFWVDRRQVPVPAPVGLNGSAADPKPATDPASGDAAIAPVPAIANATVVEPTPDDATSISTSAATDAAADVATAAPILEAGEATAIADPAPSTQEPVVQWEEIWRPRRRGRAFEAAPREKRAAPEAAEGETAHNRPRKHRPHRRPDAPAVTATGDKRRPERRDHRRDGPKPQKQRREERPRPQLQASPPGRKAAFDPDSPFAALSSLKAAMDKRTQE
jgi:ATP-dependent RNA helicase SUPV3L1/SUV3